MDTIRQDENRARVELLAAIERSAPLSEVRKLYALHILEKKGGNKVRAADCLKIDRRTLQRWAKAKSSS